MLNDQPDHFLCASMLHTWGTAVEAEMCCNGYTRLLVPFFYGSEHLKNLWYSPGHPPMFTFALIASDDSDELERVRAVVPKDLQDQFEFEWVHSH
jgi:hypothetical protein